MTQSPYYRHPSGQEQLDSKITEGLRILARVAPGDRIRIGSDGFIMTVQHPSLFQGVMRNLHRDGRRRALRAVAIACYRACDIFHALLGASHGETSDRMAQRMDAAASGVYNLSITYRSDEATKAAFQALSGVLRVRGSNDILASNNSENSPPPSGLTGNEHNQRYKHSDQGGEVGSKNGGRCAQNRPSHDGRGGARNLPRDGEPATTDAEAASASQNQNQAKCRYNVDRPPVFSPFVSSEPVAIRPSLNCPLRTPIGGPIKGIPPLDKNNVGFSGSYPLA
tara:strand:- start:5336 stop:6178 length:843 start_codon:yes stop_codon:yes gene_type:complete